LRASSFIYAPSQEALNILHQDGDVLVLSKPAGLLSVPGKAPEHADCLETRAKEQFPGSLLVHRLDMDTSGIFVMAMNKAAQANLGKQFERRKVQKTYIARVWGVPEEREGCVDLPLRCNWENRPLQMVCHEHGRLSQTDWRIIEHSASPLLRAQRSNPECPGMDGRVGSDDPSRNDEIFKISRVELKPLTGRSHQLRVHMAALGHPILGDRFYAHERALNAADRLQLHAESITLHHPKDGTLTTFTDTCPF